MANFLFNQSVLSNLTFFSFPDILLRVLWQVPRRVRTSPNDECRHDRWGLGWLLNQFGDPLGSLHPHGWHYEQWNDFLLYNVKSYKNVWTRLIHVNCDFEPPKTGCLKIIMNRDWKSNLYELCTIISEQNCLRQYLLETIF